METILNKLSAGLERGAASVAAVIDDVRFGHPAEVPRISDRSLIGHQTRPRLFINAVDRYQQPMVTQKHDDKS